MHGYIYIILKDTLKYLPLVGQGMVNYEFIFLSRKWAIDQARITGAMRTLRKRLDPMWLLIFPEGTNLGRNGRAKSASWAGKQDIPDMRHLLIPRSTGLYHCLKELGSSVEWIYDCTIAYEGIP
jgi:lysocardiolipin and lysophospholipid acyltransferase